MGGALSVVYFGAKEEWNKLFGRAASITRANLSSNKVAMQELAMAGDNEVLKAEWEAKYNGGSDLVLASSVQLHFIKKSWNEIYTPMLDSKPEERWWWECQCGEKVYRTNKESGKNSARRHILLYQNRNKDNIRDVGWLKI